MVSVKLSLLEPQVRVKMVTADDEMTTDIILEGDIEEIERFRKVNGLCDLSTSP
jgi:hypothetical protein